MTSFQKTNKRIGTSRPLALQKIETARNLRIKNGTARTMNYSTKILEDPEFLKDHLLPPMYTPGLHFVLAKIVLLVFPVTRGRSTDPGHRFLSGWLWGWGRKTEGAGEKSKWTFWIQYWIFRQVSSVHPSWGQYCKYYDNNSLSQT